MGNRGFTLTETIIVLFIISFLSIVTIAGLIMVNDTIVYQKETQTSWIKSSDIYNQMEKHIKESKKATLLDNKIILELDDKYYGVTDTVTYEVLGENLTINGEHIVEINIPNEHAYTPFRELNDCIYVDLRTRENNDVDIKLVACPEEIEHG